MEIDFGDPDLQVLERNTIDVGSGADTANMSQTESAASIGGSAWDPNQT